jgi:hypothetical protein
MSLCVEKKLTLAGEIKTYQCELVSLRDGTGILRYVIDQPYDIAGFKLSPGDKTLAVYWSGRPYTLYIWLRKHYGDRAYYFNIADSVSLAHREFFWRDLAVDILVVPAGTVRVLDEHELPPGLSGDLITYIMKARDHVIAHFRDIIEEAEGLLEAQGDADLRGLR